jgi:NADPH-dependent 2,4-dienoyl-CoA reductase/sulfur reductase-like enzyme
MAAQTLREDDFKGRILVVTQEDRMPYDRPNLSKDYLSGHSEPEWMPLRPDDFFERYDIEMLRGKTAVGVDIQGKLITFSDATSVSYDKLLIATGGIPRRLEIPGAELKNVFLLRSFDNADSIIGSAVSGRRAVVIGASFIGMEAAFSLRQRGLTVTVVAPDRVPFEKTLGSDIGRLFQRVHEEEGVEFRLDARVESIRGEGSVHDVLLRSGESIGADLVVTGIGVIPATGFLNGLDMQKDGSVKTDAYLSIANGVYAAGDMASFPDARTGEWIRIEHWRTALQQGRIAAHNMAGKATAFASVPFFWTTQFDTTLNYVGHAAGWDEIVFQGDVAKKDFLAFYVKEYRILAVAGMNRDHELAVWEELIRLNRVPSPTQLSGGQFAAHLAL